MLAIDRFYVKTNITIIFVKAEIKKVF